MASALQLVIIVLVMVVVITSQNPVQARETPAPLGPLINNTSKFNILLSNEEREYLEAHNQARAAVEVDPLKWNHALAKSANTLVKYQSEQMGCQFATLYGNNEYGINQMWASGTRMTPYRVVNAWVNENKYYDYDTNTCVPDHKCGVYTQVVWKNSQELGCAQATCEDLNTSITICFYSPPGNYEGQRPY